MKKYLLALLVSLGTVSSVYAYEIINETSSYTRIQCSHGAKHTISQSSKGWYEQGTFTKTYFKTFNKAAKAACSE
jgi:hypothetical protein